MISSAFAQAASNPELVASVWNSPTLWVAISFVIFLALLARPTWLFVTRSIDNRIQEIKNKIEEAAGLREEAQDMLAANKRKIFDAEKEAGEIIAQAREEAQVLKARLAKELEEVLKRRQQIATDRISQAEADAVEAVRLLTVDIALNATEQILSQTINNGARKIGTPAGKKNEKNRVPCLKNAMMVTKTKITSAIDRVTAIWLVKVKL